MHEKGTPCMQASLMALDYYSGPTAYNYAYLKTDWIQASLLYVILSPHACSVCLSAIIDLIIIAIINYYESGYVLSA